MKYKYREDTRGYVHAPECLVTAKVGEDKITAQLGEMSAVLKSEGLTKAPIRHAETTEAKVGIFPVLRPLTSAAVVGMRSLGYLVDVNIGYSMASQGAASDVARALVGLGVDLDSLELEWMLGPSTRPKPQPTLPLETIRVAQPTVEDQLADSPF